MAPTRNRTWTQRRDGAAEGGVGERTLNAKTCMDILTCPEGVDRLLKQRQKLVDASKLEMQQLISVSGKSSKIDKEIKSINKSRKNKKVQEVLMKKKKEKTNLSAQKCRAKNNIESKESQIALIDLAIELRREREKCSFAEYQIRYLTEHTIGLQQELDARKSNVGESQVPDQVQIPLNLDVSLYQQDENEDNSGNNNSSKNDGDYNLASLNLDASLFHDVDDKDKGNNSLLMKMEVEETYITGPCAIPNSVRCDERPSSNHDEHSYCLAP